MLQLKSFSLRRAGISRSFLLGFSLLTVCGLTSQVHAEGHKDWGGNHGVNRVVWTEGITGFYGVHGEFTMNCYLPIQYIREVSATPYLSEVARPHRDTPTCYLGARGTKFGTIDPADPTHGRIDFDAGLQYSINNGSDDPALRGRLEGWQAFIRNSRGPAATAGYVFAKQVDPDTSRLEVWSGGLEYTINSTMTFEIHSGGGVSLNMNNLPRGDKTFFWNDDPEGTLNPSSDGNMFPHTGKAIVNVSQEVALKRAIGMTRTTGHKDELDGSWLQCTWSNGELSWREDGQSSTWAWNYNPNSPDKFLAGAVDQTLTGYDAPGNTAQAKRAKEKKILKRGRWYNAVGAKYKVDFPNLSVSSVVGRTNNNASRQALEAQTSRYRHETVGIWLRQASKTDRVQ